MRGKAPLPVPPRPEPPKVLQAFDADGGYIGTWPIETSEEDIREEAKVWHKQEVSKIVKVDAV
jgi:hypothetical protein